jgi:LemA protein
LIAVSENYPELKSNQNFRDLQFELAGTENRIAVERQRYNDVVRQYNTAVRVFPSSMVAGFRGFTPRDAYIQAEGAAREVPKVEFGAGG